MLAIAWARIGRLAAGSLPVRKAASLLTSEVRRAHQANQDRRQRAPKLRRQVTNWSEHDAALRQRGTSCIGRMCSGPGLDSEEPRAGFPVR
jgi:hypothetical protein